MLTVSAQAGVAAIFLVAAFILLLKRKWLAALWMGTASLVFIPQLLVAMDAQWTFIWVLFGNRNIDGLFAVLMSKHTLDSALLALQYGCGIAAALTGRARIPDEA